MHRFITNIEKSLLSSLFFEPENIEYISSKLSVDDFYVLEYANIYKAILKLYRSEYPIDEDFLLKKADDTINEQALLDILSANPISDIKPYVNELKVSSTRRKLQNLAYKLNQNSSKEQITNDELFELLKQEEQKIRTSGLLNIDIKSSQDIKEGEPEFYIKDWLPIPKNTISLISSPGGVGKTWLVLQLAIRFIKENPTKKCFLWLSEDLNSIVKSRLNSILQDIMKQINDTKNIYITDTLPPTLLKKVKGSIQIDDNFRQIKAELKEFDFIVFDPLLAFYGGDENDNSQARIFMQPFMNWALKEKKTIVFLHHSNKSKTHQSTRGAGAFVDAARLVYQMDKIYKKDKETLNEDELHLREIRLVKDNYGVIKYLKNYSVKRWITPKQSAKEHIEVVETVFDMPNILM